MINFKRAINLKYFPLFNDKDAETNFFSFPSHHFWALLIMFLCIYVFMPNVGVKLTALRSRVTRSTKLTRCPMTSAHLKLLDLKWEMIPCEHNSGFADWEVKAVILGSSCHWTKEKDVRYYTGSEYWLQLSRGKWDWWAQGGQEVSKIEIQRTPPTNIPYPVMKVNVQFQH